MYSVLNKSRRIAIQHQFSWPPHIDQPVDRQQGAVGLARRQRMFMDGASKNVREVGEVPQKGGLNVEFIFGIHMYNMYIYIDIYKYIIYIS